MHVGSLIPLQNDGTRSDEEVYAGDLRLVDIAVDAGFNSLWAFEHHFTDSIVSPDPLQLLAWLGSRHPAVQLGTAVIVLPWPTPSACTPGGHPTRCWRSWRSCGRTSASPPSG